MTQLRTAIPPLLIAVLVAISCHGADESTPPDPPDPQDSSDLLETHPVPRFRLLEFDRTFGSIPDGAAGTGDDSPDRDIPTGRDVSRLLRDSDHDLRPPQISMPVRPMGASSSQSSTRSLRSDGGDNWLVDQVIGLGKTEEESADPKEEALRAIRGERGTDGAGDQWLAALIEENARATESASGSGDDAGDSPELGDGVDPIVDLLAPDGVGRAGADGSDSMAGGLHGPVLDPMLGVRLGQALRAGADEPVQPMARIPGEVLGVALGGGAGSPWEDSASPGLGTGGSGSFGGAPVGAGSGGLRSGWAGAAGATSTVAGLRGLADSAAASGADRLSQAGLPSDRMESRGYRPPPGINDAGIGNRSMGAAGLDLPSASFDTGPGFSARSGAIALGSGETAPGSVGGLPAFSPWGQTSGGPISSGMANSPMRSPFDPGRHPTMAAPPSAAGGRDWLAGPSTTPRWDVGRNGALPTPGSMLGGSTPPSDRSRFPSMSPAGGATWSPWAQLNSPLDSGR